MFAEPDAQLGAGVVDKQGAVGRLWTGAYVPPRIFRPFGGAARLVSRMKGPAAEARHGTFVGRMHNVNVSHLEYFDILRGPVLFISLSPKGAKAKNRDCFAALAMTKRSI